MQLIKTIRIYIIIIIFDPATQFPEKKNYAMQRQNTKTLLLRNSIECRIVQMPQVHYVSSRNCQLFKCQLSTYHS